MKSETRLDLSKAEIGLLRELATGRPKKVIGALATKSKRHGLARLVMAGYVLATTPNPPETIFEITDIGCAALAALGRRIHARP
jgi:hypothetical protein